MGFYKENMIYFYLLPLLHTMMIASDLRMLLSCGEAFVLVCPDNDCGGATLQRNGTTVANCFDPSSCTVHDPVYKYTCNAGAWQFAKRADKYDEAARYSCTASSTGSTTVWTAEFKSGHKCSTQKNSGPSINMWFTISVLGLLHATWWC